MLARTDELLMKASNDDVALVLIAQPQKRWTTFLDLAAATAMTLPLLGGVFLLTTEALSKPDAVSLAFAQPVATLQIVVGLMLMAGLLLVPARRLVARAGSGGTVEIDGGIVRVAERGLFSSRSFHEPLDAYRGLRTACARLSLASTTSWSSSIPMRAAMSSLPSIAWVRPSRPTA